MIFAFYIVVRKVNIYCKLYTFIIDIILLGIVRYNFKSHEGDTLNVTGPSTQTTHPIYGIYRR